MEVDKEGEEGYLGDVNRLSPSASVCRSILYPSMIILRQYYTSVPQGAKIISAPLSFSLSDR